MRIVCLSSIVLPFPSSQFHTAPSRRSQSAVMTGGGASPTAKASSMKKTNSTVYVSLTSLQPENMKLVGFLRRRETISTSQLDLDPTVVARVSSIKRTASQTQRTTAAATTTNTTSTAAAAFDRSVSGHCTLSNKTSTQSVLLKSNRPFVRDKWLRRSLPRVLIHAPNQSKEAGGGGGGGVGGIGDGSSSGTGAENQSDRLCKAE